MPKTETGFLRKSEEQHASDRKAAKVSKQESADGKKVSTQAGPEYDTLKATNSRREKNSVAKARAKNNSYRDNNSNAGRGKNAEIVLS
jgi:hypothetical protein